MEVDNTRSRPNVRVNYRRNVSEYSRLQVEHPIKPSDPEDFHQVRMDMLKTQAAPANAELFLEVDQLAQDGTREVLNPAEVDDKPHAGPHLERVDQPIQQFRI